MIKTSIKLIAYIVLLWLVAPLAAQQPAALAGGEAAKAAPKKAVQGAPKAAQHKRQPAPRRGRPEKLACRLGSEDRHARIAIELIGGRVESIAYYSKWKPRTCSVHIVRDDAFSKWEDTGHVTVVTLSEEKGSFLIDHNRRAVKFLFRDIDRERFCGMEGKITGSLTVTRGRDRCELEGVMDEGEDNVLRGQPAELQAAPAS